MSSFDSVPTLWNSWKQLGPPLWWLRHRGTRHTAHPPRVRHPFMLLREVASCLHMMQALSGNSCGEYVWGCGDASGRGRTRDVLAIVRAIAGEHASCDHGAGGRSGSGRRSPELQARAFVVVL